MSYRTAIGEDIAFRHCQGDKGINVTRYLNGNVYAFTRAMLPSMGISYRRVSVCPSIRLSVCHKSVYY